MAKHNKLHDPKKSGFKNKTRGGYRVYIFRTDSKNKKGRINGVVLEGDQVTVRSWLDNGGWYTSGQESAYDLIPLKDKKAHFDDLTQIDVPFGDLDKDTQKRLKAWPHGIEHAFYTTFSSAWWFVADDPDFFPDYTYRAIPEQIEKPKPKYEVGRWYPWSGGECPLPDYTKHEVLLANGLNVKDCKPQTWKWNKIETSIVAFKVFRYA